MSDLRPETAIISESEYASNPAAAAEREWREAEGLPPNPYVFPDEAVDLAREMNGVLASFSCPHPEHPKKPEFDLYSKAVPLNQLVLSAFAAGEALGFDVEYVKEFLEDSFQRSLSASSARYLWPKQEK